MASAASAAVGKPAPRDTRDTLPFSAYEWLLASRYLRARRAEGFISVIAGFSFTGIMLGVATLIIVMAVMNGFRNELFSKILGLNGHIIVNKIGGPFEDYDAVAKRLAAMPGVKAAMPLIEGQVMVSSAVQATGALVRGMTEEGMRSLPLVSDNIRFGSLTASARAPASPSARGSPTCCASTSATRSRSFPRAAPRRRSAPRREPSRTSSRRCSRWAWRNTTAPWCSCRSSKRSDTSRAARRSTPSRSSSTIPRTSTPTCAMPNACVGPTNHVSDWRARNETFFTVLEVERNVMFIILSLIVLVAALNIISGLMMLVKDKGRDVAILRTMGATRGAMMRVFLITGASIGVVGTLAGLVLGIVFCLNIERIRELVSWMTSTTLFDPNVYYLTRLPADMEPRETATIVIMALAVSVLATLYPSWRASTLDPVEALRYE